MTFSIAVGHLASIVKVSRVSRARREVLDLEAQSLVSLALVHLSTRCCQAQTSCTCSATGGVRRAVHQLTPALRWAGAVGPRLTLTSVLVALLCLRTPICLVTRQVQDLVTSPRLAELEAWMVAQPLTHAFASRKSTSPWFVSGSSRNNVRRKLQPPSLLLALVLAAGSGSDNSMPSASLVCREG